MIEDCRLIPHSSCSILICVKSFLCLIKFLMLRLNVEAGSFVVSQLVTFICGVVYRPSSLLNCLQSKWFCVVFLRHALHFSASLPWHYVVGGGLVWQMYFEQWWGHLLWLPGTLDTAWTLLPNPYLTPTSPAGTGHHLPACPIQRDVGKVTSPIQGPQGSGPEFETLTLLWKGGGGRVSRNVLWTQWNLSCNTLSCQNQMLCFWEIPFLLYQFSSASTLTFFSDRFSRPLFLASPCLVFCDCFPKGALIVLCASVKVDMVVWWWVWGDTPEMMPIGSADRHEQVGALPLKRLIK